MDLRPKPPNPKFCWVPPPQILYSSDVDIAWWKCSHLLKRDFKQFSLSLLLFILFLTLDWYISKSHSYTLKLFMLPFYFCYCKYVPSFKWTNKNLFLLTMNRIIVIPELSFPSQVPYSHVRRPTVFHCEAKKTVNIRNISAILLNFNHNHKLHWRNMKRLKIPLKKGNWEVDIIFIRMSQSGVSDCGLGFAWLSWFNTKHSWNISRQC